MEGLGSLLGQLSSPVPGVQLLDGGRGPGREEDREAVLKGPGGAGLSRAAPSSASTQQRITCEDSLRKSQETGGSLPTAPSPWREKEEHSPELALFLSPPCLPGQFPFHTYPETAGFSCFSLIEAEPGVILLLRPPWELFFPFPPLCGVRFHGHTSSHRPAAPQSQGGGFGVCAP